MCSNYNSRNPICSFANIMNTMWTAYLWMTPRWVCRPDMIAKQFLPHHGRLPAQIKMLVSDDMAYRELKIDTKSQPNVNNILAHSNGLQDLNAMMEPVDLVGYVHAHGLRGECLLMSLTNTMVPESAAGQWGWVMNNNDPKDPHFVQQEPAAFMKRSKDKRTYSKPRKPISKRATYHSVTHGTILTGMAWAPA